MPEDIAVDEAPSFETAPGMGSSLVDAAARAVVAATVTIAMTYGFNRYMLHREAKKAQKLSTGTK